MEVVRLILFVCLFINIFSFSFLFVEHLVAHLQNVFLFFRESCGTCSSYFVCLFINIFSFSFLFVEHLVAHLQNVVFLERVVELVLSIINTVVLLLYTYPAHSKVETVL